MQFTARPPALLCRIGASPAKRSIQLGSNPANVEMARHWARCHSDLGLVQGSHLALVVSELVTNALRHTASGLPEGKVLIQLALVPARLVLSVTDDGPLPSCSPSYPQVQPLCPDSLHGRGLRLVTESVVSWEWERTAGGTVVHAYFNR